MEAKYNFELDMVNTNSLSLMLNQIRRGSTVLEFGPANGRMTKYLKEELDCKVYLVELDEEAGREALQYGEELVADDIETYSWYDRYEALRFDYITFADVLEHLRNPEQVLIRAKTLLKQDGSVLLSVPNLAHNSVIISLLNNEFEYHETGLLDNTHIHFFTKNSLENTMNRTGLTVVKRFATYAPTGATEIAVHNEDVEGIDASFWKTRRYGEVYQYVYEAKKGAEFADRLENFLSEGIWHYFSRLYFDRGDGYSNEDSVAKVIRDTDGTITFEAIIPENVRRLRFVPFDGVCLLEPVSSTDLADGEEKQLRIAESNETMKHENQYLYTVEAPYFDLAPVAGSKFHYVRLVYRLITIDGLAIEKLQGAWDEAYRLKKTYEEDIARFMGELEATRAENVRLDEVNTALAGQVAHLDNLLKAVYSTLVWRIAERFRRLRNKILKR